LRDENTQLRALCAELEQALQEAAAQHDAAADPEGRIKEYEELVEEKSEVIRRQHQEIQELQAALAEAEPHAAPPGGRGAQRPFRAPTPRDEELLALSEELDRERRQLQEDEQTVMDQMRQMEVAMARERAEMARQRNDLQRLQSEIRHELERLERHGVLQSKIDNLKSKLTDVSMRRGAAPAPPTSTDGSTPVNAPTPAPPEPPRRDSFVGRLFRGRG
jgi:hypothetical protein